MMCAFGLGVGEVGSNIVYSLHFAMCSAFVLDADSTAFGGGIGSHCDGFERR